MHKKRVRLPKHRKKEQNDGDIIYVSCRNCEKEWAPEPWRWQSVDTVKRNGTKTLVCPDCGSKVRLAPRVVLEILRRNGNVGRFKGR